MYTRKNKIQNHRQTKKISLIEKIEKGSKSRIYDMETYKVNCGKNLLTGIKSIKSADETSMHENDFVHVLISELENYNKPVIVKVYDTKNFYLRREINILHALYSYRNTVDLICDFSCIDDKNRYFKNITNKIKFCRNNSSDNLHFFVYEYIKGGDISQYLHKNNNIDAIKSLILQTTCVIIELGSIYNIQHGDLNSGNVLVDETSDEIIDYMIDGEKIKIKSCGIIPKIIDFGRSRFYKQSISMIWFDIIIMISIIATYLDKSDILYASGIKDKLYEIVLNEELILDSLREYYNFILSKLE